jgi:peptide/nickel transport system permease protein
LASRFGQAVVVLIAVSIITFLLGSVLPGDPAAARLGPLATLHQIALLRKAMGLDRPLVVQYVSWIGGAVHGDFGVSTLTGQSVASNLMERLPVSLELVVLAEVILLAVAVPSGVLLGWRRDGWLDRAANRISYVLLAVPPFALAIVLILVFAVSLKWLPATGFAPITAGIGANLESLALPAVTLALAFGARCFRVLRGEVIGSLRQDYVLTARSEGLPVGEILRRYVFPPTVSPLITLVGLDLGVMIGSAVVIEELFALPGLGTYAVDAVSNRDYPALQGVVLLIAFIYVVINLIIDVMYPVLDPRVRHA